MIDPQHIHAFGGRWPRLVLRVMARIHASVAHRGVLHLQGYRCVAYDGDFDLYVYTHWALAPVARCWYAWKQWRWAGERALTALGVRGLRHGRAWKARWPGRRG